MEQVILNDKRYGFVKDFKHDHNLRRSYNQLTEATFGFSFEPWYRQGLWGDHYIPYSLIDNDRVIANVAVNHIEFDIEKERKVGLQLGTVMTDEKYRHQGLNRFIMNKVMNEWKDHVDFIYLFANDTVLDFYPKFNFEVVKEYQQRIKISAPNATTPWKKLNMDDQKDVMFLTKTINVTAPISKIAIRNNASLILFYCLYFMKNNVFFIEELNTIVIAEFDGDTLHLNDVFSTTPIGINDIIQTVPDKHIRQVVLGFTSWEELDSDNHLLQGTDTLFVLKDHLELFRNKQWMFPLLSHA